MRLRSWFASVAPAAHSSSLAVWIFGLPEDEEGVDPVALQLGQRVSKDCFRTAQGSSEPRTVTLVGDMAIDRAVAAGVPETYRNSFRTGLTEHLDFLLVAAPSLPPHKVDLAAAYPPVPVLDPLRAAASANDRLPASLFDLGTDHRLPDEAPQSRRELARKLRLAKATRMKGKGRADQEKDVRTLSASPWTDRDDGYDDVREAEVEPEEDLSVEADESRDSDPRACAGLQPPAGVDVDAGVELSPPGLPAASAPGAAPSASQGPGAPALDVPDKTPSRAPPSSGSKPRPAAAIRASVHSFFRDPSQHLTPPASFVSTARPSPNISSPAIITDTVASALAGALATAFAKEAASVRPAAHAAEESPLGASNRLDEPSSPPLQPRRDMAMEARMEEPVEATKQQDVQASDGISGVSAPASAKYDTVMAGMPPVEAKDAREVETTAVEKVVPDAADTVATRQLPVSIASTASRLSPLPPHAIASSDRHSSLDPPFPSSQGLSSLYNDASDDDAHDDLSAQEISDFVERDLASSAIDEDEFRRERAILPRSPLRSSPRRGHKTSPASATFVGSSKPASPRVLRSSDHSSPRQRSPMAPTESHSTVHVKATRASTPSARASSSPAPEWREPVLAPPPTTDLSVSAQVATTVPSHGHATGKQEAIGEETKGADVAAPRPAQQPVSAEAAIAAQLEPEPVELVAETAGSLAQEAAEEFVGSAVSAAIEPLAGPVISDAVSELAGSLAGEICGELVEQLAEGFDDVAAPLVSQTAKNSTKVSLEAPKVPTPPSHAAAAAAPLPVHKSLNDDDFFMAQEEDKSWMEPVGALDDSDNPFLLRPGESAKVVNGHTEPDKKGRKEKSVALTNGSRRSSHRDAMSLLAPSPVRDQSTAGPADADQTSAAAQPSRENRPAAAISFYSSPASASAAEAPVASASSHEEPEHDVFGPVDVVPASQKSTSSSQRSLRNDSPAIRSSPAPQPAAPAATSQPLPRSKPIPSTRRRALSFAGVEIVVPAKKRVAQPAPKLAAKAAASVVSTTATADRARAQSTRTASPVQQGSAPFEQPGSPSPAASDAPSGPQRSERDVSVFASTLADRLPPPVAEGISWLDEPLKKSRRSPHKYGSRGSAPIAAEIEALESEDQVDDPLAGPAAPNGRSRSSSSNGERDEDDAEAEAVARSLLKGKGKARASSIRRQDEDAEETREDEECVSADGAPDEAATHDEVTEDEATEDETSPQHPRGGGRPALSADAPPTRKKPRLVGSASSQTIRKPSLAGKNRPSDVPTQIVPHVALQASPAPPSTAQRRRRSSPPASQSRARPTPGSSARSIRVRKPTGEWWNLGARQSDAPTPAFGSSKKRSRPSGARRSDSPHYVPQRVADDDEEDVSDDAEPRPPRKKVKRKSRVVLSSVTPQPVDSASQDQHERELDIDEEDGRYEPSPGPAAGNFDDGEDILDEEQVDEGVHYDEAEEEEENDAPVKPAAPVRAPAKKRRKRKSIVMPRFKHRKSAAAAAAAASQASASPAPSARAPEQKYISRASDVKAARRKAAKEARAEEEAAEMAHSPSRSPSPPRPTVRKGKKQAPAQSKKRKRVVQDDDEWGDGEGRNGYYFSD
ncbi:uncharacterized protein JCM10292_006817 [Rhodotorula paludigena]|uniref:uncharacterized protein n=1 Tax=Rhodotorula paludigena TaxID=86838 RepID=UPI003173940B